MQESPRNEWPMAGYMSAWKTFRRLSDENRATARHLLSRPRWPSRDGVTICDVGCGDGRLAEMLLLESTARVSSVVLVDPDETLLDEARVCVSATDPGRVIEAIAQPAEKAFPRCAERADVSMLVHVVYLLRNGALRDIVEVSPPGMPLYVVLDAPGSVFSQLWERTAPKYAARAAKARTLIESLPQERTNVHRSTFSSTITNPFKLGRPDLRDAVLSLLCYRPVDQSTDAELHDWIAGVIRKHAAGMNVVCDSVCYEIVRR